MLIWPKELTGFKTLSLILTPDKFCLTCRMRSKTKLFAENSKEN